MWSTETPTEPGHYWAVWAPEHNRPQWTIKAIPMVAMIEVTKDYKGELTGWGIGGEDGEDTAFVLNDFSHWLPVEKPDLPDHLLPATALEAKS
jgi:hypothetical protein